MGVIKFLIFLIYTMAIFFIDSYVLLIGVFFINVFLMVKVNVSLKKALYNLFEIGIFIAFVVLINILFTSVGDGILVGVRLLLVCNITYTFSKTMSPMEMSLVLEKILSKISITRENSRDIGIIICISLAFIPIFKNEITEVLTSMKSKCIKVKLSNLNLIMEPILINTLRKINDMEMSLKAKAYM